MIVQMLSHPEVQHRENLKGFLPRYQRLHEEAKDLARPVLDVLNEELPQVVQTMDLNDLQMSVQAQQPTDEPEDPRRRRNRRHAAGEDIKSEASTSSRVR